MQELVCLSEQLSLRQDSLKVCQRGVAYYYNCIRSCLCLSIYLCFPGGSVVKNLSADAGHQDSIPELGRSPGERNDSPCQHSCLENPMDRECQQATVHGKIRVRHDLATKHQQIYLSFQMFHLKSQKNTVSGLRQWFVQQGLQVGWQKKSSQTS